MIMTDMQEQTTVGKYIFYSLTTPQNARPHYLNYSQAVEVKLLEYGAEVSPCEAQTFDITVGGAFLTVDLILPGIFG